MQAAQPCWTPAPQCHAGVWDTWTGVTPRGRWGRWGQDVNVPRGALGWVSVRWRTGQLAQWRGQAQGRGKGVGQSEGLTAAHTK